ncbi:hypothetical protein AVEN_120097-1 [Araneus ventricosus]|uniref:Uncharacterized protein n=1 Tax=Araneus ventricosus TaxID=182803 RepID=A0A4Y2G4Z5_ARAVE|nr:hypothetical protein AVEN_120097-1 [Araneus ventricosus]
MDIQGRIVSAASDECHSYQFLTQASCCVYVTGSTNLTTRVKSVCEKRLWGIVEIKKCVNCQFELQKWKVPSSDEEEVDVPANTNITAGQAKAAVHIMLWTVQKTWKKRISQLFFGLKT